jgi:hypothetical protein
MIDADLPPILAHGKDSRQQFKRDETTAGARRLNPLISNGWRKPSREKQIKKWNRAWKIRLIEERSPQWRDLWGEIIGADTES